MTDLPYLHCNTFTSLKGVILSFKLFVLFLDIIFIDFAPLVLCLLISFLFSVLSFKSLNSIPDYHQN